MSNEQSGQVYIPSTTPPQPLIKADIPKAFVINKDGNTNTDFKIRSEGFGLQDILIYLKLKEMMLLRNALNQWFAEQLDDDIPF